jgi:hypothetical protein
VSLRSASDPKRTYHEGSCPTEEKEILETMEMTTGSRWGWWWYVKFVFACQAAGFALWMLVALVAMPFVGHRLFDLPFEGRGYMFLPLYLVCAPIVWKYLR